MPRILVEHGPPGVKGVDTIMGIGQDDLPPDHRDTALRVAFWGGIVTWLAGVVADKPTLRGVGLGAVAVGYSVRHLEKG